MNSNRIFVGNVYHANKDFKENVILVQAKNKKYLKLEHTKYLLYRVALQFSFLQDNRFLSTNQTDPSYVNEESLKPYVSVSTDIDLKRARNIHKKSNH